MFCEDEFEDFQIGFDDVVMAKIGEHLIFFCHEK